jgi:hypothetical protein
VPGAHLPEWLGIAAALGALLLSAWIQFRHMGLALVVVLAPLPGGILASWLGIPEAGQVYLCGVFVSTVLVAGTITRICEGEAIKAAAWPAWKREGWLLTGVSGLAVCTAAIPFALTLNFANLSLAGATLLSVICSATAPPVALLLPFGPDFVAHANRVREKRERWLDRLSFVVQPRWGWSIGGIALIFAVLGFFGADRSAVAMSHNVRGLAAGTIVLILVAGLAMRDLQRILAVVIAAVALFCLSIWAARHPAGSGGKDWLLLSLALMPAMGVAILASAFGREGDNTAVATLRAMEQLAASVAFFCAGAAVALLAVHSIAGCILVLCGAVVALAVLPALITAIFDLFPPRARLDAYRVR